MNGMKAKKERREQATRLSADGLPRDSRDWLYGDWKDLHEAIEALKVKVRARHKNN